MSGTVRLMPDSANQPAESGRHWRLPPTRGEGQEKAESERFRPGKKLVYTQTGGYKQTPGSSWGQGKGGGGMAFGRGERLESLEPAWPREPATFVTAETVFGVSPPPPPPVPRRLLANSRNRRKYPIRSVVIWLTNPEMDTPFLSGKVGEEGRGNQFLIPGEGRVQGGHLR